MMTEATLDVDFAGQDAVIPFQVAPLDVRGRSVQLGPMLDSILGRHDYPEPVARLLAEAITLTVLLGTSLKFEGKFILQTQTDGPVSMIVTDFQTPRSVRAYARFDEDAIAAIAAKSKRSGDDGRDHDDDGGDGGDGGDDGDGENGAGAGGANDSAALLGRGTLAMTIDQGAYMQRYQGIVQLDGTSLEEVARQYFRQSEQIPTDIRLAVGEVLTRREGQAPEHGWTAGGILVQFLPDSEERMRQRDLHGGDGDTGEAGTFDEDEAWAETKFLMQTVDDVELTDVAVQPEALLYRLFHEHGVHVYKSTPVKDNCSCSHEKVSSVLAGLSAEERQASVEDGSINVTCEFCSQSYQFDPATFSAES